MSPSPGGAVDVRRTASTRRYLMCPPTYFDVVYSINPWMDPSKPIDPDLAALQWQRIRDLYVELGHTVEFIEPVPGLPDMVFAANGATVMDGRALVSRFLHDERAAEAAAYTDWFVSQGFEVRQAAWTNEGEGDCLAAGGWVLAGSGFRTDRRSHVESEEFFGRPVIGLTLVDDNYYHLDTALGVLDEQTIMYYPAAFSLGSQEILRGLFPDAITVTDEDAAAFGVNATSDGHHVVMPAGATHLAAELRSRGFEPVGVDVSELLRAGGGVKCCTLELRDPVPAEPETRPASRSLSVIVTSVASDSHNWNLVFLQLHLEELGHQVLNLGPCVPDELLVSECLRTRPDLVVVSTVNGHGFFDGRRLIGLLRACPELAATRVVIGGKLGIAGPGGRRSRDELLSAGFDAVFEEGTGMVAFRAFTERLTAGADR
ncbi:MAG TPA: cobalamin-dependent protein [Streptosporangiaceae bacterium]|jgi:N-dimethylarginine dimethylaminohydrolase/methylmalonyl-CoA mutase cobalamin-binding subunit